MESVQAGLKAASRATAIPAPPQLPWFQSQPVPDALSPQSLSLPQVFDPRFKEGTAAVGQTPVAVVLSASPSFPSCCSPLSPPYLRWLLSELQPRAIEDREHPAKAGSIQTVGSKSVAPSQALPKAPCIPSAAGRRGAGSPGESQGRQPRLLQEDGEGGPGAECCRQRTACRAEIRLVSGDVWASASESP